MGEVVFTPAEIASWRVEPAFMIRAAAAYAAGRLAAHELRACSHYAAGGKAPPISVVQRVNN